MPATYAKCRGRGMQWAKAQEERNAKAPIVLMANVPKAELDEIVDEIRAETGLEIMAREGLPYSLDDLDMVNAAEAKSIIIMGAHADIKQKCDARDPVCISAYAMRTCARDASDGCSTC